jgi:hypothetical protein
MASSTKITEKRTKAKQRKAGHKRKAKLARHGTTPSQATLFGDEPHAARHTAHANNTVAHAK